MSQPVLEFREVGKRFYKGDTEILALERASFGVGDGEFLAVVGPSGRGKSTLLNLAAGLNPPSYGEVLYRGQAVRGINTKVGYITQRDNLLEWATTYDNIVLPLRIRGMSKAQMKELADKFLAMTGLTEFARHFPAELSGGMRKRVALARTLIYGPELVMMDEPFSALDAHVKMLMHEELLRIWETDRRTILFITHDLTEAITLSDRIVVMSARPGKVKLVLPVDLPRPRDPFLLHTRPEFIRLYEQIWSALKEDIRRGDNV